MALTPEKWRLKALPLMFLMLLSCSGLAWGSPAGVTTPPGPPDSSPKGAACPLDLSTGPKGDIRDIRGPVHIPDPRLWLFYALGGILLALPAWAAWKWFSKRRSLREKAAHEIAFEELEKAEALMTPEMAEAFSVMVSNTIRTYIEKRFQMRATRKTTHEFITRVTAETDSALGRHSETLRDFLAHCDLAKFARQTFSREQMKKMHQSAWRFVEATRPQPEKEVKKDASTTGATAEKGKNSVKGRTGFFKDRFKGVGFSKKARGTRAFENTRQIVSAGGG